MGFEALTATKLIAVHTIIVIIYVDRRKYEFIAYEITWALELPYKFFRHVK